MQRRARSLVGSLPGRGGSITLEAKAWLVSLACPKAKELGYPHELWTTRVLASHAREHGPAEGHACFARLAQGTVCKILDQEDVKPHKVRYYLERRDPPRKSSGSSLADRAVDPTKSQNITVSWRRSASSSGFRPGVAAA